MASGDRDPLPIAGDAEWRRSGAIIADDVCAETALARSDVALEIGCGAGRVGRFVAPRCAAWIGADIDAGQVRLAADALRDLPNARLLVEDGADLRGVESRAIDVVYSTGVFMYLDEWARYRCIAEAYRTLRPGGRLYVDTFNLAGDEGWALFEHQARRPRAAAATEVRRPSTPQELETFLTRAGFTGIRLRRDALWLTAVARR